MGKGGARRVERLERRLAEEDPPAVDICSGELSSMGKLVGRGELLQEALATL